MIKTFFKLSIPLLINQKCSRFHCPFPHRCQGAIFRRIEAGFGGLRIGKLHQDEAFGFGCSGDELDVAAADQVLAVVLLDDRPRGLHIALVLRLVLHPRYLDNQVSCHAISPFASGLTTFYSFGRI